MTRGGRAGSSPSLVLVDGARRSAAASNPRARDANVGTERQLTPSPSAYFLAFLAFLIFLGAPPAPRHKAIRAGGRAFCGFFCWGSAGRPDRNAQSTYRVRARGWRPAREKWTKTNACGWMEREGGDPAVMRLTSRTHERNAASEKSMYTRGVGRLRRRLVRAGGGGWWWWGRRIKICQSGNAWSSTRAQRTKGAGGGGKRRGRLQSRAGGSWCSPAVAAALALALCVARGIIHLPNSTPLKKRAAGR